LTGAKADERHVLLCVLGADPSLLRGRQRQVVIATRTTSAASSTAGYARPG